MRFLALTLYLMARITLTLISSLTIIGCFRKVNFQGFNLVTRNFESSAFLSASFLSASFYSKNRLFYVEIQRFSENQGKFSLCNKPLYNSDKQINYKSRVKLVLSNVIQLRSEQYFVIYFEFFTFTKEITKSWSVVVVMSLNR